ncbi:MAG: MFS transporter [Proteobacteria bacterium]|nr:MFS transporter [Pseudomonadota bacterium]
MSVGGATMTPRAARTAIRLGNVAHAYSHLFMPLFFVVALVLETEFQVAYERVAALGVPMIVLFGAGALPSGWLGDRWSGLGMMVVFYIGIGAAAILTAAAPDLLWLGIGLSLIGLCASIYHPVGIAWLVRVAPNRGRALGVNGVFGMFGPALAVSLGAVVTHQLGWRWAFLIPGLVAIGIGLYFWALIARGALVDTHEDVAPVPPPGRAEAVRAFVFLFVCIVCNGIAFQAVQAATPKLFAERLAGLGIDVVGVGALYTVFFLIAGSWQVVTGRLADRYPQKAVYLISFLAQPPLYLLAAVLESVPLAVVAVLMLAANVGAQPVENSMLARLTPQRWRSMIFGIKFVTTLTTGALGVALVPFLYGLTGGFYWLFMGLAGLVLVALLAALMLPGRRGGAVGQGAAARPAE